MIGGKPPTPHFNSYFLNKPCIKIVVEDSAVLPKTAKHLGTLLVTKEANDIDITEGRIASARRCICGFMSLGCRITPITPFQELEYIAPCP